MGSTQNWLNAIVIWITKNMFFNQIDYKYLISSPILIYVEMDH